MPEISIIVPVYRTEKYLNACVDSILSQTFSDFELVLIEDGARIRAVLSAMSMPSGMIGCG